MKLSQEEQRAYWREKKRRWLKTAAYGPYNLESNSYFIDCLREWMGKEPIRDCFTKPPSAHRSPPSGAQDSECADPALCIEASVYCRYSEDQGMSAAME
jgi:hypothetical protein